ncbi:MAG: hypothetical protein HYV78_00445 [Candidatus Wildermuthbacteria bacterium]|nr:hypothetical protein [Candidatus Wildermuthbacteria bacterium]
MVDTYNKKTGFLHSIMELNTKKFALALAKVMGVWYVLCATLVALAPELGLKLFGWMIHLVNLESVVNAGVTATGFVAGLVEVAALAYATAWAFAWLYNRSLRQ